MANPVLVEVTRGNLVESRHRGMVVAVDGDGKVVFSQGDIEAGVFPRSACKAMQGLPLVESGAADAYGFGNRELALACSSHSGEPEHASLAGAMLAAAGVDESVLECGAHWSFEQPVLIGQARGLERPSALHNNCSGKHAGFVCLACHRAGATPLFDFAKGYVRGSHPVMCEVTQALQTATGWDLAKAPQGTDGCSIPTFGIPLQHLARAFARVGSGIGLGADEARAARRLRQAVAKAPFMVAGTDRFDTLVMQRLGERVFCKVGAEGVYCAALPARGLGVALKIDDGNNARAAEVVMAALIEAFVPLDDSEAQWMRCLSDVCLKNWNGIEVGRLCASPWLRAKAPASSRPQRER